MRVLDIAAVGSFMQFAAEGYGVYCTGVTTPTEQASFAQERCDGLPVRVQLADYRNVEGRFDRIVSLGMFEHVGHKNHATYMRVAERCLADDGLFLLHTIGRNEFSRGTARWIDRYIVPNGDIPIEPAMIHQAALEHCSGFDQPALLLTHALGSHGGSISVVMRPAASTSCVPRAHALHAVADECFTAHAASAPRCASLCTSPTATASHGPARPRERSAKAALSGSMLIWTCRPRCVATVWSCLPLGV